MANEISAVSGGLVNLSSLRKRLDLKKLKMLRKVTHYQTSTVSNRLLQPNSHGSFIIPGMTIGIPGDTKADNTINTMILVRIPHILNR